MSTLEKNELDAARPGQLPPCDNDSARQGEQGTSTGVNLAPGSDDDGWTVPEPIRLADGTRLQLYKDGEALHAAFDAIKHARRRICLEAYIFANDDTGNAFADLLATKATEGVRVYVIYDSFGSLSIEQLWKAKPPLFRRMRKTGVQRLNPESMSKPFIIVSVHFSPLGFSFSVQPWFGSLHEPYPVTCSLMANRPRSPHGAGAM